MRWGIIHRTTNMIISQDIIEELTEGNQEAVRIIFKAAYPQVRAFSIGLLKNDADADQSPFDDF